MFGGSFGPHVPINRNYGGGPLPNGKIPGEFEGLGEVTVPDDTTPVYGVRVFRLSDDGFLTGVTFPQIWMLGTNFAKCLRVTGRIRARGTAYYSVGGQQYEIPPEELDEPEPDEPAEHSIAGCTHGFYAYYEGSNDYHREGDGYIQAVVRGFGTVVIGTRGFRCTKASIVALTWTESGLGSRKKHEQMLRRYSDVPWFTSFEEMVDKFPADLGAAESDGPPPPAV